MKHTRYVDDWHNTQSQVMSSPAVEGLDVVNVPKYGVLLAADLCWCISTGCLGQVVEGEQVYLFHKLCLAVQQLLDEMAKNTDKTSRLSFVLLCQHSMRPNSLTITSSCILPQTPPPHSSRECQPCLRRAARAHVMYLKLSSETIRRDVSDVKLQVGVVPAASCPGRQATPSLGGTAWFWWVWCGLTISVGEQSPRPQHTVPPSKRWTLCSPSGDCSQLLPRRCQTSVNV